MELTAFIGKVVVCPTTHRRFALTKITSPSINVTCLSPAPMEGTTYVFHTINGDPISNGTLVFEDARVAEPFKEAYAAYCRTKDAYWEEYGYWMRKD